jgi:hypothetical protein
MFEHSVHVSNENLKLDYLRIRDNASSSLACGSLTLQIQHVWACFCMSPTNNWNWYTVSSLNFTEMNWVSIRPEFIKILFPKMLSVDMQLNTESLLRFTSLDYILARTSDTNQRLKQFNRLLSTALRRGHFGYCCNLGSYTEDSDTFTFFWNSAASNSAIQLPFFVQWASQRILAHSFCISTDASRNSGWNTNFFFYQKH